MCGRYYVDTEEQIIEMREIIDEINRKLADAPQQQPQQQRMATGEIRPTNVAPVIARGREGIGAGLMAWGFPKWNAKGVIINARSETVPEKAMFRAPFREGRRVVVPTTGFFEWRHENGKAKEKYRFLLPGEDMLYLCGLYAMFEGEGGKRARFVILTTAANESMAPYHDRMPVLLRRAEWDRWLLGGEDAMEILLRAQPPLVALEA